MLKYGFFYIKNLKIVWFIEIELPSINIYFVPFMHLEI